MATKLEKEIDKLAREAGYPHMKLDHVTYMKVLKQAHDNVYPPSPTVHTEQEQEGKVMRLLESLTPGGSEFYNDPERCVEHIKQQLETQRAIWRGSLKTQRELKAENESLKAANKELYEALLQAKDIMQTYNLMLSKAGIRVEKALNNNPLK